MFFWANTYTVCINRTGDTSHETHFICFIDCNYSRDQCIGISGFIVQGIGAKRCKESKRRCQMHNRHGSGFKPDMQFAPLCKMHRHGQGKKMQRLATMARFAQSIIRIRRLAQWRIRMLPRNGPAIKNAPRRIFLVISIQKNTPFGVFFILVDVIGLEPTTSSM